MSSPRRAFALVLLAVPTIGFAGSVDTPTKGTPAPSATKATTSTTAAPAAATTPYVRTGKAVKSFDGWYYLSVPLGLPKKSLRKLAPAMEGAAQARGLMAYAIDDGVQVWATQKKESLVYSSRGGDSIDVQIGFAPPAGADTAALDAVEAKLVALHESLFADAKVRAEAAKAFE